MEKLRSSLEAHKSALELALDMISLSLTKDIKADTMEIRNDTAAIKDDTALILQEIAELQARLPDTSAAPNDYILQRFLEDMATYTETTLDANVSYSDGMSSRALSMVDEHDESSPKSLQHDLPILATQNPDALEATRFLERLDALRNARSHDRGRVQHPIPTMEDIPHRPKGPGPASSYAKYSYDKEVTLSIDPQAPGSSSLALDSGNEETQNRVAPSLVGVQKESKISEFALLDAFDPLWRQHYGSHLQGRGLSNDAIRENQEFVIGILNQVKTREMLSWSRDHEMIGMDYIGAESERGHSLPRGSMQTNPLVWTPPPLSQQLVAYMAQSNGPIPREEGDAITSPSKTKDLSSQAESRILRFRGNVVVDIPVPDRILARIPQSSHLDRNEFTHSRFSFITCPPEEFGDHNYTLRATLFAQPRQTEFILVVQIHPNDEDFIRRWDLIHDSIIFTQKKLEAIGDAQEFWKRVVVHLHLAHGTEWEHRSFDNPFVVLEAIAGIPILSGKLTQIGSEHHEPIDKDSSEIGGHPVYATMSEYTVQLRQLDYSPGAVVTAEVPIQVIITTARVPESLSNLHWSNKYIPWTGAINKALQAQHVIDMTEISDAFLSQTDFLWEVLREDRPLPVFKHKPLPAWDLDIFRFDGLVAQIQADSRVEKETKKRRSRVRRWLKPRVNSSDEDRR